MTYHFANDRFTNPEIVRNFEPSETIRKAVSETLKPLPVARFKLNDQHDLIVRKSNAGLTVTCDTCSLSATAAKAVIFAFENGVFRMMIDGANFKRI